MIAEQYRLIPLKNSVLYIRHVKRGVLYNLSLAELIEQDIVSLEEARRFLHCQLATGGVIDSKVGIEGFAR